MVYTFTFTFTFTHETPTKTGDSPLSHILHFSTVNIASLATNETKKQTFHGVLGIRMELWENDLPLSIENSYKKS